MRLSTSRYWREIPSHYRLIGLKCNTCNRYSYPPKPACPYCGSRNVERVELPKEGKLLTYTVIYATPEGFRDQSPLLIGLIELPNGAKVISQLTDVDVEDVKVGMKLEAVLRRVQVDREEGLIYYALKFRPKLKS